MAQSAKIKVVNKLPSFGRSAVALVNVALNEGAAEILTNAKMRAPFKKGQLRSNTDITSPSLTSRRISFWIEYARFQEFGGDNRRRVQRYTTSGTGPHYLQTAGNMQLVRMPMIFAKHLSRAKAL